MTYIDAVVEVLRSAPGPLTTHEISDAVSSPGTAPSSRRPSDATITTWLYAITGSHDHPGVHRLDRTGTGRDSTCWVCDAGLAAGATPH